MFLNMYVCMYISIYALQFLYSASMPSTFMQMANHKNETHQEEILQFKNVLITHIVQAKLMDSGLANI